MANGYNQKSFMSIQRTNTNKSSQILDANSTEANHYLQKAVKVMRQLTQAEKSLRGLQNQIKVKKLTEINKHLQLAARKDPMCISILVENKVLIYIKHFFTENVTKAPALCFLRLLIPSQCNANLYLSHNIPFLLAKVLQKQDNKQRGDWEDESTQALKLIAQWINYLPDSFPRILATTLVCFGQLPALVGFQQKKKDHISQNLKLLVIEILLSLTQKNLDLSLESGGFSLLVNSITDPIVQQRSQDILIRILYFLNEQKTRQKIWLYVDLKKLFSVFTDLDYVFIEDNSKNKGNIEYCTKLQTQLSLSKQSLLTILKSWTGIILLANDSSILQTILQALKQIPKKQDSQVRKVIYSLLEQILSIGQGLLTGGGFVQFQNDFRASSLLSSYMIALLKLLMDHGLFKLLIQLSGIDQPSIAEPAQKLLKKLSIYIFNFLPDAANYMDFLISAGTKKGAGSEVLKYSSSFIVSKIGNYVFDGQKQMKNSFLGEIEYIFNLDSIFMPLGRTSVQAISKNLNFLAYRELPNYRKKLLDMKPIPKQHKQNFKKWDWNAIIDLLSFPDVQKQGSKPDSSDKYKEFKLFKYLLRFYSYSRGNFAQQKWSSQNLIYIKVGKLLIQNTLMIPDNLALVKNPPESQFQCTISFIGELEKILETSLINFSKNSIKYYSPFFKTLERQLVLWIGSFSFTKIGYESLLCQNNFFQILQHYIPKKQCCYVISAMMFFFDFYRDSLMKKYKEDGNQKSILIGPRHLLIKCVKEGSKNLKVMSIQVIKLLYRAELTGFTGQGIRLLLILSLEDCQQIWINAIQTIQFLIKDKQLLQTFLGILIEFQVQNKQKFAVLKDRLSSNIYIRITSLSQGIKFISQKNQEWLDRQYEKWVKPEASQKYFDNLQQLLNNCLNFSKKNHKGYKIQTQGKDFIQWSFLYKLPWLLYVNQAQEVPLLTKLTHQCLLLYSEFTDEQYEFRSSNPQNSMKICLGIGSMYLDEELSPTKTKFYNTINLNLNTLVKLYGQEYYCSTSNGISVYFLLKPQGQSVQQVSDSEAYANSYDIKRIHIQVKLSSFYENQQLPLHLMQQITKTEQGMQFLESKQLTLHSKRIFQSNFSSTLQIRSVLWSLGYYGSTNEGMSTLIKQKIAEKILDLSMNSPTLSLRGTCRYVLNMFCHSEVGRGYLLRKNLSINKKSLSCFPMKASDIYSLNNHPQQHMSQKQSLWNQYQSSLVPMNQNEKKLFDSISLLINSLSSKQAINQIKEMIKGSSKISFSFPLLQNVVNLMSYFKMKYQARKTIHFIFEEFMKSNEFTTDGNGKINYAVYR